MADAPKLPRRPGQPASSSQRSAPARPNLRPSQRVAKPAAPAPASSEESLLDDEPLIEDGDVPMRNGPRNIADAEVDDAPAPAPAPVRPKPASARLAPAPAPAAKAPASISTGPKPVAKSDSRVAPPPVKPPAKQSARVEEVEEEEDIDFDSEDPEATKEMPAPKAKKKGSAREEAHQSGRRVLSAKQRPQPDSDEDESDEEDAPRTSKRSSAKRSGQQKAVGKKGIPKLYLIGAGVAVVALLVVVLGYKHFMLGQYESAMKEGATIQDRKAGAEKLVNAYPDESFKILTRHIAAPDAQLREAAIHGMSLYSDASSSPTTTTVQRRSEAISELATALASADVAAKKQTIAALKPIAEKVAASNEKPAEGKVSPQEEQMKKLAAALIPLTEPGDDQDLRRETVGVLAHLRTPGVCKQMIKLASTDAQLKDVARAAIPSTVLPDAAGDLLRAMKSEDKALADTAKRAFVGVRDSAPSKDLLPLVGDPSADVRREIVEALGKRGSDTIAQQGITKALKDSDPAIRLLAVKSVPTTGLTGGFAQLGDLSKDADENVRVASGEVFGKLRDGDSYTALLATFKNSLDGKTLDAYVKALGARARGKDMKNIGMVIGLLDTNAASEASLREALVLLSNNGVGPQRDKIRKAWTSAQWKQWYAKFNERETLRAEAAVAIKEASAKRNADRDTFKKIKEDIEKAMDKLEKAQALCQPDDAEDAKDFDKEMKAASVAKEYFIKGASFNLR